MALRFIFELRQQPVLIGATTAACMKFAYDITNESEETENHAARMAWALASPDSNAAKIMPLLVMNQTIQDKWVARAALPPPGNAEWLRFDDGDIEFVVSGWINAYVLDPP